MWHRPRNGHKIKVRLADKKHNSHAIEGGRGKLRESKKKKWYDNEGHKRERKRSISAQKFATIIRLAQHRSNRRGKRKSYSAIPS